MGYNVIVEDMELTAPEGADVTGLYMTWKLDYDTIELSEHQFKWSNSFIDDLVHLHSEGVRGYLITVGEGGDWEKYILDDEGTKLYEGTVTYEPIPSKVYRKDIL